MKHTFRSLAKSPGFAFTALATLAICLAANLTIFAVVDAVLLRPLPYADPDRLVTLYYTYPKLANANNGSSITNYYERRGQIPAFSSLSAISEATSVVGETGATAIEPFARVTPEFFATLGVKLFLGRPFTDAELTYQTDHVAIISYEYWHHTYNADPQILGKSIRLDGIAREIVGVLPPDFRFLSFQAPVYGPLSSEEGERNVAARHSLGPIAVARLAPGATMADATAQLAAHDAAHAGEFAYAKIVADAGAHTVVASLRADHVAAVRPTLLILQAGALLLLAIGAVNLVNLFLVRASSRTKELAIRQALGASQRDVIRDVMSETVLLTLVGAALGLGLGAAGIRLLAALGLDDLPLGATTRFDFRVALVALATALGVGVAIGLPVAWFNLRHRLASALQTETRGSTVSRATQRLRHGFIIAQIAVAFVLLTGAGLLGLSLRRAMAVAPGFRTDHIITGQFTLTWAGYHTNEAFPRFFDRLDEASRSLPGVSAVGVVSNVPLSGAQNNGVITIPGRTVTPGESLAAHPLFAVAGNYFQAMGIPLRAGRYLDPADAKRPERTCVVDEDFARLYWPAGGAVGQQLYRGTPGENEADRTFTIVGVVGTVKRSALTETKSAGAVYFPYSQLFNRNFFLVARTSLPPASLANSLARLVREIDPEIPLTDLRSMELRIQDSLADRRSPALLVGIFAAAALLLATIGLYGVMAYSVSQRVAEFGIRMALGAQRFDVLRLVLRQGLRLVVLGLAIGLACALLLTGLLSSQLFGVSASDPLALGGVAALLGLVAVLACLLPARRATKVDPMIALRAE